MPDWYLIELMNISRSGRLFFNKIYLSSLTDYKLWIGCIHSYGLRLSIDFNKLLTSINHQTTPYISCLSQSIYHTALQMFKAENTCFPSLYKFNMCQNNLENQTQQRPFPKHFITNNPTHKQTATLPHYQRLLATVAQHEVDSYCMMLQARINNKNPFVVNVLAFQLLPPKQTHFLNSKEVVEILVCTDKMMPLADHDWTKDNLVKILLGLKRLTMIYGPFGVGLQQIGKNEH